MQNGTCYPIQHLRWPERSYWESQEDLTVETTSVPPRSNRSEAPSSVPFSDIAHRFMLYFTLGFKRFQENPGFSNSDSNWKMNIYNIYTLLTQVTWSMWVLLPQRNDLIVSVRVSKILHTTAEVWKAGC